MKILHKLGSRPPLTRVAVGSIFSVTLLSMLSIDAHAVNPCNPKNKFYNPNLCEGEPTDSGERIDLNCALAATSGDGNSDSVKSDGESGVHADVEGAYVDAEEKVSCSTGGTAQPNLSGLGLDSKKKGGPAKRKIDLAFTNFEGPDGSTTLSPYLPTSIFTEGPTWDDMEIVHMAARPYRDEHNHIQLLDADETYEMALRFRVKPADEHYYIVNLADTDVPGDKFTGIWCESTTPGWPNSEIVKYSQDVTVYLWPDLNLDDVADGYTVTTGQVLGVGEGGEYSLANPPTVVSAPRTAAFCSPTEPIACDGAGVGDVCNFLGFADVEFTWHAENK